MIIILNGNGVQQLFTEYDDKVVVSHGQLPPLSDFPERLKFVVFTGGTDVNPMYYGEGRLIYTDTPDRERDGNEALWFSYCRVNKIPMVGICRGAQFGCVMSGGSLYQHVTGHAIYGTHPVVTDDNRTFGVTSTHHQMMAGIELTNHELLAWASPSLSRVYAVDAEKSTLGDPEVEPEVVYFKDTNFLSVQYHPEYMESYEEGRLYFDELLNKYIPNLKE